MIAVAYIHDGKTPPHSSYIVDTGTATVQPCTSHLCNLTASLTNLLHINGTSIHCPRSSGKKHETQTGHACRTGMVPASLINPTQQNQQQYPADLQLACVSKSHAIQTTGESSSGIPLAQSTVGNMYNILAKLSPLSETAGYVRRFCRCAHLYICTSHFIVIGCVLRN